MGRRGLGERTKRGVVVQAGPWTKVVLEVKIVVTLQAYPTETTVQSSGENGESDPKIQRDGALTTGLGLGLRSAQSAVTRRYNGVQAND